MKLGILNACSPADEAEFGSQEFPSFQTFLAGVEHHFTLTEYRITEGEFPAAPAACDAYLITGSPKGVYDEEPWIAQLQEFIRAAHAQQRKLVGICFGHQILAHALGGHTEKSEKGWGIGRYVVDVQTTRPWMQPALPTGGFYFCHQDQVKQLPTGAERLAGNEFCPNGMFVIGDQVFGLQAHPEFTPQVMTNALTWLRTQVDPTLVDQAAARTDGRAVDNAVMAQWIVNFLTAG
jgi:GMP synthase-like glutamine amidotransferase